MMNFFFDMVDNIAGKGENAQLENSICPIIFQKTCIKMGIEW